MSADDDFPRGWSLFTLVGAGSAATLTVPAAPGVSHVLTHADIKVWGNSVATGFNTEINSPAGDVPAWFLNGVLPYLNSALISGPAASYTIDSDNWDGQYVAPINSALIVFMAQATPVGNIELLRITGYDI